MNKLNYNKVLLTGATGLLGSWVADKLLHNNVNLTGVAIDNSKDNLLKYKEIYDEFDLVYLDISKDQKIDTIFEKKTI